MRQIPRPSPAVLGLLLALLVPAFIVVEDAHTNPAPPTGARAEADAPLPRPADAAAERVRQNYGQLPLSFEANRGQADARVRFLARGGGYSLHLTDDEIALALRRPNAQGAARARMGRNASGASVLRIKL